MSNASSPYDSIESTLNESYNDINEGKSYADNYLILLFHSTRRRLLFILMLFFFVFSLLVNSLSFIVLMRRVFFLNAYAFGQRCLCVLDIGFALVVTMGYVIQGVLDNDYGDWDTNLCLTIRTIGFIVASISNWTIVYLSTIRYASLRYPHQLQSKRFREASYATLWIISFVISLFYVTFIFNMERFFTFQHTSTKALGMCRNYITKNIHVSIMKAIVMLPETILPGICIVVINTKMYSRFRDISRHADVLKHALHVHSARVAKLRQSLRIPSHTAHSYLVTSKESRFSLSESDTSLPASASYAKFFSRNLRRLSSINQTPTRTPTVTFSTDCVESNLITDRASKSASNRKRLSRKLNRERQKLRQATITYGLLCEGFIPTNRRHILFADSKPQEIDTPSGDNERGCCRVFHSWLTVPSLFARQLIIISTLIFVLLNAPYCIWYIFSHMFSQSRVGVASNSFINTVAAVLKCGFHASNCVVYILSSQKVRSEVDGVLKKYQCYN